MFYQTGEQIEDHVTTGEITVWRGAFAVLIECGHAATVARSQHSGAAKHEFLPARGMVSKLHNRAASPHPVTSETNVSNTTRPAMLRSLVEYLAMPSRAREQWHRDFKNRRGTDPGPAAAIAAAAAWIVRAQQNSASHDGGVARHYSTVSGWSASYPETTGYIVPTMIDMAHDGGDAAMLQSASRMLDWLVSIQYPDGSFPGGTIADIPQVPVVFNTGQILIGLAAGVRAFGNRYLEPMRGAANWLVEVQDADGCWRRFLSPFAMRGERTYDTHVAWGLLEAARVEPGAPYADAALRNIRWALTHQHANGWFDNCCLAEPGRPLTHTIGYTLRGVIEGYRFSDDQSLLHAARRTADALLPVISPDGFLPGRLDADWQPAARWACLTGSVQIAACYFLLHEATGSRAYLDAAMALNRYVRTTISLDGPAEIAGGVKGSFPIFGEYGRNEYLNWAAKFMIDASRMELKLAPHRQ